MIAKAVNMPGNFAELLEQLGDIPPARVRMKPPPGTATEEDLNTPRGHLCELIDGVLVEKAVGDLESVLGLWIGSLISTHVVPADLGVVLGADGHIRVSYNGTQKADIVKSGAGWYFKAGSYVQSNLSRGDAPDAQGQVVIYTLHVQHAP